MMMIRLEVLLFIILSVCFVPTESVVTSLVTDGTYSVSSLSHIFSCI